MTIREKVTHQKRLADIVSIAGIGGAILFFYVANSVNRWWVFAGIPCALAAFSSTVYRYYAIRCPECSARLTGVITISSKSIRCPGRYCLLSVLPGELRCRGSIEAIGLTNR